MMKTQNTPTLRLVTTMKPMRMKGIYAGIRGSLYVELWRNEAGNHYWIKYSEGNSESKNVFGWKEYVKAELNFHRMVYKLQIKEQGAI